MPKPPNLFEISQAQWALDRAYWRNWYGDTEFARKIVISVANKIIKEEPPNGQGKS